MSTQQNRSLLDLLTGRAGSRSARSLVTRAGRSVLNAESLGHPLFEHLEGRMLLAGDHPSFALPLTPTSGTEVLLVGGSGTRTGVIGSISDDDLFRFTPTATDFVRVLADTIPSGGLLNSRIRIYNSNGQVLTRDGTFVAPGAVTPANPAQGDDNGILSTTRPNPAPDGWAGFLATAGQTYYVDVLGQNSTSGGYTVRVGTQTTPLTLDQFGSVDIQADPPPPGVRDPALDPIISFRQDEQVYKVTTGSGIEHDSLATITARSRRDAPALPGGAVDTHLDIYDATGKLVTSDIESGFLNDADATFKSGPDAMC